MLKGLMNVLAKSFIKACINSSRKGKHATVIGQPLRGKAYTADDGKVTCEESKTQANESETTVQDFADKKEIDRYTSLPKGLSGTYSEALPCGGTLEISSNRWQIKYYFPGPDYRHKGEFVTLDGKEIDKYIAALKNNWTEYTELLKTVPSGGSFSKPAEMGMTINVRGFSDGVCLHYHHMPMKTLRDVDKVISSYQYAKKLAAKVQLILK